MHAISNCLKLIIFSLLVACHVFAQPTPLPNGPPMPRQIPENMKGNDASLSFANYITIKDNMNESDVLFTFKVYQSKRFAPLRGKDGVALFQKEFNSSESAISHILTLPYIKFRIEILKYFDEFATGQDPELHLLNRILVPPNLTKSLQSQLLVNEEPLLQKYALSLLGKIGKDADGSLPAICKLIVSKDEDLRCEAICASLKIAQSVPLDFDKTIINMCKTESITFQIRVFNALRFSNCDGASLLWLIYNNRMNKETSRQAFGYLCKSRSCPREIIAHLRDVLYDDKNDSEYRCLALMCITNNHPVEIGDIKKICQFVLDDSSVEVRWRCADALGKFPNNSDIIKPVLMKFIERPENKRFRWAGNLSLESLERNK
jgi:hypothetical protein